MLEEPRPAWAEVCVNTPLGRSVGPSLGADRDKDPESRTFTYAVPERLVPAGVRLVSDRMLVDMVCLFRTLAKQPTVIDAGLVEEGKDRRLAVIRVGPRPS